MKRTKKGTIVGLCLFGLILNGCFPHVNLQAPPPNAPLEERIIAYEQLSASSRTDIISGGVRSTASVQLNNGQEIYYVDDLMPVIALDSPTAEWIREHQALRKKALPWGFATLGSIGVFFAGFSVSFARFASLDPLATEPDKVLVTAGVVSGVSLASTLVLGLIAKAKAKKAENARTNAFTTYNESLRAYLNLCESDEEYYDCSAGLPTQAEEPTSAQAEEPASALSPAPLP